MLFARAIISIAPRSFVVVVNDSSEISKLAIMGFLWNAMLRCSSESFVSITSAADLGSTLLVLNSPSC